MKFIKYFSDFQSLFYEDIVRRKKTTPFLIFVFILIFFSASRLVVIYFPARSLFIRGYHVHHFYFGVVLLGIAGYIALVSDKLSMHRWSAILYGSGLGMILDEIGLFLSCGTQSMECDYWVKASYGIFVIVASLFLSILYFEPFWEKMGRPFLKFFSRYFSFLKKKE